VYPFHNILLIEALFAERDILDRERGAEEKD